MSSLSTLPKGDSAWLLRKSIQRVMQQVSVLETNIGSSTTGNSANTQIIFNDAGTLRGDAQFTWNKTLNQLTVDGDEIISGDLTVATNVLKVDTINDRVGINTASPSFNLHVVGSTDGRLQLEGSSGYGMVFVQASSGNTAQIQLNSNGGSGRRYLVGSNSSGQFLISDETAAQTRLLIDSTGQVGIGVTPSAWATFKGLQSGTASLAGYAGGSDTLIGANVYFDGAFKYIAANIASSYRQLNGVHQWNTAVTGSVGALINGTGNFTQAMTLDASGNLSLGQSSSALQSGGTGITLFGTSASEIKFLNSTTGSSATDGTAIVTTGNNFSINNRESGSVSIGTSNTERVSVKTNGQVRFVPLAADPASAEAGDVYYNSVSNKLKCYNGTTWNDLF